MVGCIPPSWKAETETLNIQPVTVSLIILRGVPKKRTPCTLNNETNIRINVEKKSAWKGIISRVWQCYFPHRLVTWPAFLVAFDYFQVGRCHECLHNIATSLFFLARNGLVTFQGPSAHAPWFKEEARQHGWQKSRWKWYELTFHIPSFLY